MSAEKNEFASLVRRIESTLARQRVALAETELQLSAAKESYARRQAEIDKVKK